MIRISIFRCGDIVGNFVVMLVLEIKEKILFFFVV